MLKKTLFALMLAGSAALMLSGLLIVTGCIPGESAWAAEENFFTGRTFSPFSDLNLLLISVGTVLLLASAVASFLVKERELAQRSRKRLQLK